MRKARHLMLRLVLTFECVDEIPRSDQSNETSLPELSYGAIIMFFSTLPNEVWKCCQVLTESAFKRSG